MKTCQSTHETNASELKRQWTESRLLNPLEMISKLAKELVDEDQHCFRRNQTLSEGNRV